MRLFTRWLGASGPCDWMTSLPLSFLPVKKAWWAKLSGHSISQSAVERLSPRSTWWARRLNMTLAWPLWPHWATASLATDLSPSPITATQVNMSGSLVSKQPYSFHRYTVVATKHLTFHSPRTNEATLHRERVITLWVSGFLLSVCHQPLPAGFSGSVPSLSPHPSSGDWAAGLDGTGGAAVALHSRADAPPLGQWRTQPWGQRAHHQRTQCRCGGMSKQKNWH